MFTPEELQLLDSYPEGEDDPEEEEQVGAAPDLENLDVPAENKPAKDEKDSFFFVLGCVSQNLWKVSAI